LIDFTRRRQRARILILLSRVYEFQYFSQDDLMSGAQDETFGDDIYEPVLGNQEEQRKDPSAET
jgi:hypothetical protein